LEDKQSRSQAQFFLLRRAGEWD